jgi:hypothetical protein
VLPPRRIAVFLLVAAMPALAGCNVQDWYNHVGTVQIQLDIQPATASRLNDFQLVKVALYGVTLKQAGDAINAKQFSFGAQPKIVEIVQLGKTGGSIPLTEFKTNLRATERVQVKLVVFEAIDAAGNSLEICRLGTKPARYPCFYQPNDDALYYEEKPFSPPRGGLTVVHFPVAIKYAQQGQATQYFLYADPTLVELENHR